MANWKYNLSLRDFYYSDISINEKSKKMAEIIRRKFPFDMVIDDIADCFEVLQSNNTEDFDDIMKCFYDWADQEVEPYDVWPANKMCWIETGGPV